MLKIGITERGDAGLDFTWAQSLINHKVDGAILITKNINSTFTQYLMDMHTNNIPIILHATCTGWGNSEMEPNVPCYQLQMDALMKLIDSGFPKKRCVVRIDPIIPNADGLHRLKNVLNYMNRHFDYFKDIRVRISILDEYKHVKDRLTNIGLPSIYDNTRMFPNRYELRAVANILNAYPYQFETCAEPYLTGSNIQVQGCISKEDLQLMGFTSEQIDSIPAISYQRKNCHCLSCKTELLSCKHRCPHQCLYCYWKD